MEIRREVLGERSETRLTPRGIVQMVTRDDRLPLFEEAAKKSGATVVVIGREGQQYETPRGLQSTVPVQSSYIRIVRPEDGALTDFWDAVREIENNEEKKL